MKQQIQVHIADDHKILIEGIVALLNTDDEINVEGYSLTGRQIVEWSKNNSADVLILDINMPEMDGIDVLKTFNARNIDQKTIILSSLQDPKLVDEMIKLGANGFIEKSAASEHLIKGIKTVYNNQQYISDNVKENLFEMYFSNTQKVNKSEELEEELTDKEIELLKLVAQEKNTNEIAESMNVSIRTIEHYRSRLIKKINVKNAVGLAMYAVKNNIL
ncbi:MULTISPECIES: response regulator [Tenacibaculum]|uniref:response regulator n=1 Tax=Tenacibaculum TaxID=104267 RepID=UPI001F0B2C90|nr:MULTISPECIES: response regulator transcription factor [Tenacibaculum]MCH3882878.1 response regulator transcription factor [Tenacibaculum aquimarinum]MCH3884413.1 response regulator transcription factor [Tenacibaculum aquimarinum]MDO6600413.1 response regulator transcription factor [Tenacibaculum sp. 1_MG-2023]